MRRQGLIVWFDRAELLRGDSAWGQLRSSAVDLGRF